MRYAAFAVLALVVGCDRLLGLTTVTVRGDGGGGGGDGEPRDGTLAPRCTSFADITPTQYSHASAGVALPHDLSFAISIFGGVCYEQPIDATPVGLFNGSFDFPALRPDGAELFLTETNTVTIWSSTGSGSAWSQPVAVSGGLLGNLPGTPGLAGGVLHMIVTTTGTNPLLQEWTRDTLGAWTAVGNPLSASGLTGCSGAGIGPAMLTSDALVLVFSQIGCTAGGDGLWFAQRAAIGDAFGAAQPLLPVIGSQEWRTAFVTDDCTELYAVDGNLGVFYKYAR